MKVKSQNMKKAGTVPYQKSLYDKILMSFNQKSCYTSAFFVFFCTKWRVSNTSNQFRTRPDNLQVPVSLPCDIYMCNEKTSLIY